jgi:pilus assembly protein Flp/PilA
MINMLKNLHKEESGQDLIEYALIAALIAVATITLLKNVATGINTELTKVTAQLT